MDKNKLVVFIVLAALVIVGLLGYVYLEATGVSPAAFGLFFTGILGSLVLAGGLGAVQVRQGEAQAKQADIIETVAKNVNGNSSKLLDDNERLRAELAAYRAGNQPAISEAQAVLNDPVSEDTIRRIRGEVDELPRHSL